MLEEEEGCAEVMHAIAGIRGAINGLMGEVIKDHIRIHLTSFDLTLAERAEGAAELIDMLLMYLK